MQAVAAVAQVNFSSNHEVSGNSVYALKSMFKFQFRVTTWK